MTDSIATPLGILRRGDVLVQLVAEPRDSGGLTLGRQALPDVAELRPLVQAWGRLAEVSTVTRGTVRDVLHVAAATVADPMADPVPLPALDAAPEPPRPKPTAAHPRAFQGTKYRPPKRAGGAATDLRGFLQSKLGFEQLALHLADVDPSFQLPSEAWELPPLLRLAGGAALRELGAAERGRLGALWRGMNGEALSEMNARLAVVCFGAGARAGLDYLEALARVSPPLVLPVSRGLFGAARGAKLHRELFDILPEFDRAAAGLGDPLQSSDRHSDRPAPSGEERELLRQERFVHRAEHWAESFTKHGPAFYPWMLAGMRLTAQFGWEGADWADPWRPVDPQYADAVAVLVEACGDPVDDDAWDFWHAAAHWKGGGALAQRLANVAPLEDTGDPEHVPCFRTVLRIFTFPSQLGATAARREELGGWIHAWVEAFVTMEPRWWRRAAPLLHDFLTAGDYPLPRALEAVQRLCRDPFSEETPWGWVAPELALADRARWEAFLGAPDDSWLTMAKFLEKGNEAHLLESGARILATGHGAWAARLFAQAPRAFCELAKTLGLLPEEETRLLLREAAGEGLIGEMPESGAAAAVQRVDGLGLPPGVSQVPKRLRLHLKGERVLSESQLARDEALLGERWGECVAWSMKARIHARLHGSFSVSFPDAGPEAFGANEAWSHALLFQATLETNRRSLRRLLRAVLRGDTDFLHRHPANARWLEKLKRSTSESTFTAWTQPPVLEQAVEGLGDVRLAVEMDPLEALRMGTYVGSCFGLGGAFNFSAAAVVLDANKHVVYARAEDGRFLARQILGLRSDDEGSFGLQCNDVYPPANPSLAAAFRAYDESLAAALGVGLDKGGEWENLVAEDYFDDGEWDEGVWEDGGTDKPGA